jgi:hypothetical protein
VSTLEVVEAGSLLSTWEVEETGSVIPRAGLSPPSFNPTARFCHQLFISFQDKNKNILLVKKYL